MKNDSVKNKKQVAASCQQYIKIAEIKDNIVVLKDGSLRAVVKVNSVNFDLKSEQEQNGIIYSYQEFLNTLEFPIQITIKSKKLDIDSYLQKLGKIYTQQENELLKNLTSNYIEYISKLVEMADIMQKDFYVIVPVEPIMMKKGLNPFQKFLHALHPADTIGNVQYRKGEFESLKKRLDQRIQSVINGFSGMGLNINRLNTYELIELYYNCYNPDLANSQKVKNLENIDVRIDGSD